MSSVGEAVLGLAVGLLGDPVGRMVGAMLGSAEGSRVGRSVGKRVGRSVGAMVGGDEGDSLGAYDGPEGVGVGFMDGFGLGTILGSAVGEVGCAVGSAEGFSVGASVGGSVGDWVGSSEGTAVGSGLEVSEMTIKEMRTVGSALGVKFCGKTLKADLRNILVSSKVEQVQEIKPDLREPTCLRGGDQCFQENVLRMTIKEIRKVGDELGVNFEGKTTKKDLQTILLDHRARIAPKEAHILCDNMESTELAVGLVKLSKKISSLESPEGDHIIETQMMAHCATAALKNRAIQFVPDLSHLVNPANLKNYNVCSKSVNISKGQVVRLFLNDTDGLHRDSGIRAKPYYQCYNQMGNITQAWIDTFPEISEDVRTYRSRSDFVQNGDFEQVATQLDDLFDRMKLLDVEGVVTRSKTRALKSS
eukprot:gene17803-20279_t